MGSLLKRNSYILHEIVPDTARINSCFSDFRVIQRAISYRISESPLHFTSFFTVMSGWWRWWWPVHHSLASWLVSWADILRPWTQLGKVTSVTPIVFENTLHINQICWQLINRKVSAMKTVLDKKKLRLFRLCIGEAQILRCLKRIQRPSKRVYVSQKWCVFAQTKVTLWNVKTFWRFSF